MFTGLIQATGTILATDPTAAGVGLDLEAAGLGAALGSMAGMWTLGESIAVNGCCLTLARIQPADAGFRLGFDVIHQTLRVTTLSTLRRGDRVNLERSATPTTLLGGHLVQGHVDAVGRIKDVLTEGGEWRVRIEPPRDLMRMIVSRGSIAVDGVSLTVAALDDRTGTFEVCLIPETLGRTTLGQCRRDDQVNLEADCIAKMVERAVALRG